MRNSAVKQSYPRKKLKNLTPSRTSSSLSSHALHLECDKDSHALTMEKERIFYSHVLPFCLWVNVDLAIGLFFWWAAFSAPFWGGWENLYVTRLSYSELASSRLFLKCFASDMVLRWVFPLLRPLICLGWAVEALLETMSSTAVGSAIVPAKLSILTDFYASLCLPQSSASCMFWRRLI